MFAVIRTGGKQYRVAANDVLEVERLGGDAGGTVPGVRQQPVDHVLVGASLHLLHGPAGGRQVDVALPRHRHRGAVLDGLEDERPQRAGRGVAGELEHDLVRPDGFENLQLHLEVKAEEVAEDIGRGPDPFGPLVDVGETDVGHHPHVPDINGVVVDLLDGRELETDYADIELDHFFDPIGVRLGAAYWGDSDVLRSNDWRASAYFKNDALTVSLDYEYRDFELIVPPTNFSPGRTLLFDADGFGLSARFETSDKTSLRLRGTRLASGPAL